MSDKKNKVPEDDIEKPLDSARKILMEQDNDDPRDKDQEFEAIFEGRIFRINGLMKEHYGRCIYPVRR